MLERRGEKTKVHGVAKEDEAARLEKERLAPINVQYRKTLPPEYTRKTPSKCTVLNSVCASDMRCPEEYG